METLLKTASAMNSVLDVLNTVVIPSPTFIKTPENLLNRLLLACETLGASDLHLAPGRPPQVRIHGDLSPVPDTAVLTPTDLDEISDFLMTAAHRRALEERGSADGACSAPPKTPGTPGTRFRFNIFRRQGRRALVLRRLEDKFRKLSELGLPESLYSLADLHDGLVVISGATGSGKSTTLATMLHKINNERSCHMITIEDPIEYVHQPIRAQVNQRELFTDVPDFNEALIASLRQDPDVILVGEIRELKTIRTAITAAETGHLVYTTVHAGDCVGTIERLVGVFPADEKDGIRRQLSHVLRAILTQQLLPAVPVNGKKGRVAASEILINTPAVANLVATGKSNQIYSAMETGKNSGMQTLEHDIARLWVGGRITEQTAVASCKNVAVMRERAAILRRPPV